MKRTAHALPIVFGLAAIDLTEPAFCADESAAAPLSRRQREVLDGIARHAPFDAPDRWLHELGSPPERNLLLREQLIRSVSWIHVLAYANALDWSEGERAATQSFLLDRFPGLTSGKARQNVMFLLALTAPGAQTVLADLLSRGGPALGEADRLDLRSALAALGDPASMEWFERELPVSRAFVGRPVFDFPDYAREEAEEANRETVRSYRFWEVLHREPYFKKLKLLARAGIYSMTARETSASQRDRRVARLLPAFIEKWPGHPGADNCALRLMNHAIERREEDLLFPVWANQDEGFGHSLNAVRYDAEGDRRLEAYLARTFALRRAYDLLAGLLRDHPRYAGRHQVLFHLAQAYAKLLDYKPAVAVDAWVFPERPPAGSREGPAEFAHRRAGELFRRVVEEFPECEWADEAERGAAYRLKRAGILRSQREREDARSPAARPPREY